MTDKTAAERACKDPNPVIDGRKANVNLAYIGAKPRSLQTTQPGTENHMHKGRIMDGFYCRIILLLTVLW